MAVKARNNLPNSSRTYGDLVPKTTYDVVAGGRSVISSTLVNRPSHYCSRSANVSGPLSTVRGKKIRQPTPFSRQVMDSPHSFATRRTTQYRRGAVLWVQETDDPFVPDYAAIANSSYGRIGGYALRFGNDDAKNQAMTGALNKLGDQKVNIGAALAEARKTYDMVADASTALWKTYRNARRGNWGAVAKALGLNKRDFYSGKWSANRLLATKYGLVPTLKDIHSGYEWFSDNSDILLSVLSKSASSRSLAFSGSYGRQSWSGKVEEVSYCSVLASVSGEYQRAANKGGLINPVQVAWEVVPFSFLIDWWMPVGNVLQSYTDSSGLTFISGYVGSANEATVEININASGQANADNRWVEQGTGVVRYYSTKREPLGGFPRAGVYNKQGWFNKNKGATALALFRQVAFR